jgi:hypothetical protein
MPARSYCADHSKLFLLSVTCWDVHAGLCMLGHACWVIHAGLSMPGPAILSHLYWTINQFSALSAEWAIMSTLGNQSSGLHAGPYMLAVTFWAVHYDLKMVKHQAAYCVVPTATLVKCFISSGFWPDSFEVWLLRRKPSNWKTKTHLAWSAVFLFY